MNEDTTTEALKRFGLSTYEARVFIGLTKLGAGTASEVSEVVDVPRSQVYGAADSLDQRGLLEVEHGSPTRYRPIDVDEAREKLFSQLESEGRAAFSHLREIRGDATVSGRDESIWTVRDSGNIADRVAALVEDAEEEVLYGTEDVDLVAPAIREALARRAGDVSVTVATADEDVAAAFEGTEAVSVLTMPEPLGPTEIRGRILLIDGETVLFSVLPTDRFSHLETETAFWSEATGFAAMLVSILEEWYAALAGQS